MTDDPAPALAARALRTHLRWTDLVLPESVLAQLEEIKRRLSGRGDQGQLDEADALLGKRADVKDSHDRYANAEIAYLLQRMESHAGLAILATNRSGDIDPALLRRFAAIVRFPPRPKAKQE